MNIEDEEYKSILRYISTLEDIIKEREIPYYEALVKIANYTIFNNSYKGNYSTTVVNSKAANDIINSLLELDIELVIDGENKTIELITSPKRFLKLNKVFLRGMSIDIDIVDTNLLDLNP